MLHPVHAAEVGSLRVIVDAVEGLLRVIATFFTGDEVVVVTTAISATVLGGRDVVPVSLCPSDGVRKRGSNSTLFYFNTSLPDSQDPQMAKSSGHDKTADTATL